MMKHVTHLCKAQRNMVFDVSYEVLHNEALYKTLQDTT